jgi:uncharacterized RDD family membrane protein YckC
MTASAAWFLSLGSRRLGLPEGEHVIGRSRDSDVVVRDATVSRAHALVAVAAGRVTLQDLGSSNGTMVNGERVQGETALSAGDQLRLGRVRMTLVAGAAEPFGGPGSLDATAATCPACGAPVPADAAQCPACGEALAAGRPLSRSEAVAMSEVMAVGEALARPPRSLDDTVPPYPAAWERPGGRAPGADEDDGDWEGAAHALPRYAAPDHEPPAAALEDASSPVAVARAAEEDSPPPRPPRAAEAEPEDAAGGEESPGGEAAGAAVGARAPLFLPAAGFWARAAAFAIDLAGPLVLALVAGFAASGWSPGARLAAGVAAGLLGWMALTVPFWRRHGDSPGKRLLGLRVCDLDGTPGVGGRRALLRFAGYVAGVLTLGVGFLVAGLSAGRRGLHDRLAGTYVGRVRRGRLL